MSSKSTPDRWGAADPLQAQLRHPGQLGPVVGEVGGGCSRRRRSLSRGKRSLIWAEQSLTWTTCLGAVATGRTREQSTPARAIEAASPALVPSEKERVGRLLQLGDGGSGQPVGEGMGMDVDDHGDQTVPFRW